MSGTRTPRSCCCNNKQRLENAKSTLEVLKNVYNTTEREIAELQAEEKLLKALHAQQHVHESFSRASPAVPLQQQSNEEQRKTVPPGFAPRRGQTAFVSGASTHKSDSDSDVELTPWMDPLEDLDYDSTEEINEKLASATALTDTEKKREIYKAFNPRRMPKSDKELDRLVHFPETQTRREIKLVLSDDDSDS